MGSSRPNDAPRKNRQAGSLYVLSNVRFARPCWSCRARNTTGLTFSLAHRKRPVQASHRGETWRPQVWRERGGVPEPRGGEPIQRQFFVYAGPLDTVVISPAAR